MRILLFIALSLFSLNQSFAGYEIKNLKVLEVNSSINPATLNYLEDHLSKLKMSTGDAALLKINTPGGLVSTTKEILALIGTMDTPIFIWITPEGASATSAGAIIASSAHLLFMSPGTNIGAATPVGLGKDIKESDGRSKSINDLVALVTSLSEARGRNAKKFSLMITKAESYSSQEALKNKIVNGIVNNMDELLSSLKGKEIKIKGTLTKLSVSQLLKIENKMMDPGQSLLNIFANPMTAYILFIVGAALLYFEFQAPGGFIAGSVGALCLVLAAIGFQVLPLNYGALGLVLLSFILFILEAYITSYGVLTLSGIASLTFGSLFLFRTENAYLDIHLPMILSVVAVIVLYILFIAFLIFKSKSKERFFSNKDCFGIISHLISIEAETYKYQVKINGEIWNTYSDQEFSIGTKVKITEQNNSLMTVTVKII
jgi:membrane-bound serine protease (ClpP class)